jgi:hypothetical protein
MSKWIAFILGFFMAAFFADLMKAWGATRMGGEQLVMRWPEKGDAPFIPRLHRLNGKWVWIDKQPEQVGHDR